MVTGKHGFEKGPGDYVGACESTTDCFAVCPVIGGQCVGGTCLCKVNRG